ncbi:hypothetical protein FB451DRAFT_268067 [Mycena latifolia]|nr:hypothetical protein FB451DRAFT_268067 [Mycena latifolia]
MNPANAVPANDIDLSRAPLADVFHHLQCGGNGLTQDEANRRLQLYVRNSPRDLKQEGTITQFLSFLWNPVCWILEVCALGLITLSSGKNRPPDWPTFLGIIAIPCLNAAIGVFAERRAFGSLRDLMQSTRIMNFKAKVKRDGLWTEIDASQLVRGDIVALQLEDTVPADCRVTTHERGYDLYLEDGGRRRVGDRCLPGMRVRSGNCEAIIIYAGPDTFQLSSVYPPNGSATSLHGIVAQIVVFCLAILVVFVIAELLVLYAGFHYSYRRGIDAIFVLFIGSIPIALPTLLSVTMSVGVDELARHGVLVTRVAAVEELARVTVMCLEMSAVTQIEEKKVTRVTAYGPFSGDEVLSMSDYAKSTKTSTTSNSSWDEYYYGAAAGHSDIEIFNYQPLSYVDGPIQVTYRTRGSTTLKRVMKGMTGHVIERCTRNRTVALEDRLEADIEDCARRGISVCAMAYEELEGDDPDAGGNGFELIGILHFGKLLRPNAERAVSEMLAMGVQVKISTTYQLAIAKEVGRQLGLGDHMFPSKVFRDEANGTRYTTLDELILNSVGFAGVFPEHKLQFLQRLQHMGHLCAMTALSTVNVGITVGPPPPNVISRAPADLITAHPSLFTIVHAVRDSRQIFRRLRSAFIYVCATTIRTVLCFAVLAFVYKLDFPPFMILLVALATNVATLTLSVDRTAHGTEPGRWDLTEIFSYSAVYGVYLTLSTITFVVVALKTNFFERRFALSISSSQPQHDNQLRTLIYLQVSSISHALIFVVRSEHVFFRHLPSTTLFKAFCVAQICSSITAAYGNWGFAKIHAVSAGWIGLVWVWNIIWFAPLDFIKFGVDVVLRCRMRHLGLLE